MPVEPHAAASNSIFPLSIRPSRAIDSLGASLSDLTERYYQILQAAVETAIVTLTPEGRVTGWSAGASRILGWSEEEMLGQSLSKIFPGQDGESLLSAEIAMALDKGTGSTEGWRVRKSGEKFWAVGETKPIFNQQKQLAGLVKVIRDRTEQRSFEIQLQEQAQNLAVLHHTGSILARENDLGVLVQTVTDAAVDLSGAQFGAFFYNIVDVTGESYQLYSLSGASRDAFSKFPMPRNTAIFSPTFSGESVVRSDDITKDVRYGRNAPYAGMPPEHLPVRSYLAIPVISRGGPVIGGLFLGHSEPSVFTEKTEKTLFSLAGEAAVAIDNARLVEDVQRQLAERTRAEEALRELNASLEDLVHQRTEELNQSNEALRQSQKMEAVGQLTGGIAHDFNNLLQIITGNIEIISRSLPEDMVRLRRAAAQAKTGAERAAALTQRLLAFARKQPLQPKAINLNALILGMSDLLYRSLGETVNVETVLGAGIWKTEADPNQLESALLNLAVNARDAMPSGGKLTIETSNSFLDEIYASRQVEVAPGQYVVISVSDTGEGMDTETISRVFEPFFTTKAPGKGTGLGLSQVYGFVKQTGGHVKIYSEVGHGTTVKIYLPRLIAESASEEVLQASLAPEGSTGEIVLVVEDDADVRAYSVEVLRELGYTVLEAADGHMALRILENHKVDLIFTDVVLPGGMTGAAVAAQGKALQPNAKVLFTTGYARNAIIHHGRLDAGLRLITKPFSYQDLAAKIRDALDQRS